MNQRVFTRPPARPYHVPSPTYHSDFDLLRANPALVVVPLIEPQVGKNPINRLDARHLLVFSKADRKLVTQTLDKPIEHLEVRLVLAEALDRIVGSRCGRDQELPVGCLQKKVLASH